MTTPGLKKSAAGNTWRLLRPGHPASGRRAGLHRPVRVPNIPCAYPVVWVKAREAAEICSAVGERLADAHEWEGACQGALAASGLPL